MVVVVVEGIGLPVVLLVLELVVVLVVLALRFGVTTDDEMCILIGAYYSD
jgi:hypothetical protein